MRPVAVYRFKLEVAGRTVCGLAFDDEAAMERFLLNRGTLLVVDTPSAPSAPAALAEPASRGRPSPADAIRAARAALTDADLAECIGNRAVARAIQAKTLAMFGAMRGISIKSIERSLKARGQSGGQVRDKRRRLVSRVIGGADEH